MICTSTPVRSSTYLSAGFNLPTLRSIGFGSPTHDYRRAHLVPPRFPGCGPSVSLRFCRFNGLTSPWIRTPWPVVQNGRMDPVSPVRGRVRSLGAHAACRHLVSGSFHLPSEVLFSFRSHYYFAIGLGTYLGSEVCTSQLPARFPTHGTQDTPNRPSTHRLGDFHPLRSGVPAAFGLGGEDVRGSTTPHLAQVSPGDSVCPLPFSIAFTHGISIDFSSSPY
jgi:hypothetical protein